MQENKTLLIHIDDDEDDRMSVKSLIDDLYPFVEVMQFAGGEEALFYLRQHGNASQPSLILLDINMPKIDGRRVLIELKSNKNLSAIPVVIFTTSNSELDKCFARKNKVEMVTKPHTVESMSKALKNIIELAI